MAEKDEVSKFPYPFISKKGFVELRNKYQEMVKDKEMVDRLLNVFCTIFDFSEEGIGFIRILGLCQL